MWEIDNETSFAAEGGWVRNHEGAEVWLVAVKATFDIAPDGSLTVSPEQPPVLRVPEYVGDPGRSSLKFDTDLVLTKQTTDVTVVGHAYAPDERPVTQLNVGVRVGPIEKRLVIFGDRRWGRTGCSSPEPFVTMPLLYERAFGGVDAKSAHPDRDWDWRNPIGTGFCTSAENAVGTLLPNIEYPDQLLRSWQERPAPAGLGPVQCHWQPRAALAGTYDDAWARHRQPLLPADFDDRFFQCAPRDQQASSFFRGGEPVFLYGLAPTGEVGFTLPKIFLGFETYFENGTSEVHRDRALHSVIIDTDAMRVSLVWHTALMCHFLVHKLDRTLVVLKEELGDEGEDRADA